MTKTTRTTLNCCQFCFPFTEFTKALILSQYLNFFKYMNIGNPIISFGSLVRLAQIKEPLEGKCLLNNSFGSFK